MSNAETTSKPITSPITALTVLYLFMRGQHRLTEAEFDDLFDIVVGALEELNDERYRFAPDTEPYSEIQDIQEETQS